jgi:hypothetical protein
VILITNGVELMEVERNRAGGAIETIQLTERELPLNFQEQENTGVEVRLNWQRFSFVANDYAWLDRTKLEGLGFDYARAMRDPVHPPLPRPAFVVLEYNGPAWEKWLNSARESKRPSGTQPEMYSRLFPVDVASTPEVLLRAYPDRAKYLIVKGVVQLLTVTRKEQLQLWPSISQVLPDSIHVPLPPRPRYTLTVAYGRGFEPWLVRVDEPGKD